MLIDAKPVGGMQACKAEETRKEQRLSFEDHIATVFRKLTTSERVNALTENVLEPKWQWYQYRNELPHR